MISIQYKNTEMLKFLYPKKNHRFNVSILNFLNNLRNLASLAATLSRLTTPAISRSSSASFRLIPR